MTKELSTYGVILLGALVIFRATTINHSVEKEAIAGHISTLSPIVITKATQLKDQLMAPVDLAMVSPKQTRNSQTHTALLSYVDTRPLAEVIDVPQITETNGYETEMDSIIMESLDISENEGLTLERESTINSNLSLLFPRQRILQKPTIVSLGE